MENKENNTLISDGKLKDSHGTGVLSTMIFMVVAVSFMIILKNVIG